MLDLKGLDYKEAFFKFMFFACGYSFFIGTVLNMPKVVDNCTEAWGFKRHFGT